jgi:ankyrin repeat protein
MRSAIETGENIDLVNDNGYSAAMFTVISGDITMLRHLIEKGIDLNNPENNGVTPLMMAASQVSRRYSLSYVI